MLQNQLLNYLQTLDTEEPVTSVSDLHPLHTGWENEVFGFQMKVGKVNRDAILRLYQGFGSQQKAMREYKGMASLKYAGYPVPEVWHVESDATILGKPFSIVERVNGPSLAKVLREAEEADRRFVDFCGLFVQLHQLDWRMFTGDTEAFETNPFEAIDRFLTLASGLYDEYQLTELEPVLSWLQKHKTEVPCERPSVVHWDFHPENILCVDRDGYSVIDWTQIEVSDARFDVAWTAMVCSVHQPDLYDAIVSTYEKISGANLINLSYFEVAVSTKRWLSMVISLFYGPERLGMRAESLEVMANSIPYLSHLVQRISQETGLHLESLYEINHRLQAKYR